MTEPLDFALGEMADAIRDTTARFAADRIAPIAQKVDEEDWFPIELWPGDKICQLKFHQMHGDAIRPYGTAGNHYQHQQRGPVLSRSHLNVVPNLPPVEHREAA